MEGFWSPLELLSFLVWLCDLWVGGCEVWVMGSLESGEGSACEGGAVGSLIGGGWLGVAGSGSVRSCIWREGVGSAEGAGIEGRGPGLWEP